MNENDLKKLSKNALIEEVKKIGVKGYSSKNKSELIEINILFDLK